MAHKNSEVLIWFFPCTLLSAKLMGILLTIIDSRVLFTIHHQAHSLLAYFWWLLPPWPLQLWPSDFSSSSSPSVLSPLVFDKALLDPLASKGPCGEPDWEMFMFALELSPLWSCWVIHRPPLPCVACEFGSFRTWRRYFCAKPRNWIKPHDLNKASSEICKKKWLKKL